MQQLPLLAFLKTPAAQRRTAVHLQSRRGADNRRKGWAAAWMVTTCIFLSASIFVILNVFMLHDVMKNNNTSSNNNSLMMKQQSTTAAVQQQPSSSSVCALRRYPPHRYYHLTERPDFLTTETEYIYGKWPVILPTDDKEAVKICVDQSEWFQQTVGSGSGTLPFADGTNPSILTVRRLQSSAPAVYDTIRAAFPATAYLATACLTNSQCRWKDSSAEIAEYRLSKQRKPTTVRTVLLLLDGNFATIAQSTIYLDRDAAWGRKFKKPAAAKQHLLPALDDARLFVHGGRVWVSYREGPGFGWDAQVLNPVHIEFAAAGKMSSSISASETASFCCGRNMALMENVDNTSELRSLTWVDPVTVVTVDTTPLANKKKRRRLSELQQQQEQESSQQHGHHRRLAAGRKSKAKKKSHIHGTNAFMVYLSNASKEFLGVAHFHRPNDRQPNPYARFGHHYTHAFYTVSTNNEQQGPRLTRLSPEFVLPASHNDQDAEMIQFASGLEYDADSQQIILAYGLNDCEAAVVRIDYKTVESMLRPVQAGKQVVDYMQPLSA